MKHLETSYNPCNYTTAPNYVTISICILADHIIIQYYVCLSFIEFLDKPYRGEVCRWPRTCTLADVLPRKTYSQPSGSLPAASSEPLTFASPLSGDWTRTKQRNKYPILLTNNHRNISSDEPTNRRLFLYINEYIPTNQIIGLKQRS